MLEWKIFDYVWWACHGQLCLSAECIGVLYAFIVLLNFCRKKEKVLKHCQMRMKRRWFLHCFSRMCHKELPRQRLGSYSYITCHNGCCCSLAENRYLMCMLCLQSQLFTTQCITVFYRIILCYLGWQAANSPRSWSWLLQSAGIPTLAVQQQ